MDKSNLFLENLTALIHWTYGCQARATELAMHRIVNTNENARSVYIHTGDVKDLGVFLGMDYNKTRSISGSDQNIMRFLEHQVSILLLAYIIYIRPMEM